MVKRKRTNGNGNGRPPHKRAKFGVPRTGGSRANNRTGGFMGIELKFYDTSLSASALTAPGDATGGEHDPSATVLLNTVVQGTGEEQRDGKQIVMKSVGIRGHINVPVQANQTATDVAPVVLVALVLDTQTNGATIASENVFKNKSASGSQATNVFRNLQFSKRFRVLKRVLLTLEQPTIVWDGTNLEQGGYNTPFEIFANLKDQLVNYSSTTETVANITDNSLHVIAYCNSNSSAPTISYNARLRFVG